MTCKVIFEYIYAETSEYSKALQIDRIHQVDPEKLSKFIESKEYVLTKDDLVTIFEEDGAHFYKDSIRIRNPKSRVFNQVGENFKMLFDPNENQIIEEFFWLKARNTSNKKKLDELTHEGEKSRKEIEALKQKIENMEYEHKLFRDEIKQLLQSSNQVAARLSNSTTDTLKHSNSIGPLEHVSKAISQSDPRKSISSPMAVIREDQHATDTHIDIAFVYSEPLWIQKGLAVHPVLKDPVDFEGECSNILETLRAKKKDFSVFIDNATRQKLVSLVAKKPDILHIICHGDHNKQRNEYYLCFETKDAELYEFYSSELKGILNSIGCMIQLVFVNACHSEEVARVFLNAGVPCVIAVQSAYGILDDVATNFSHHFYDQLSDGKTIREAFEIARTAASSKDCQICCCAHSHKEGCYWHDELHSAEPQKAHDNFHALSCKCLRKHEYIHDSACAWARGVLIDLEIDRDPDSNDNISVCCCRPELPHDETLKFILLSNNPNDEQIALFRHKLPGRVKDNNPFSTIGQNLAKRISGRNCELFKLHRYMTDENQRFVHVYGSSGVGKRTLVHQMARYLYERRYFTDKIVSLKLEKVSTIDNFYACLLKEFPGFSHIERVCDSMKNSKILLIFENCDSVINSCKQDFVEILKKVKSATKYVKFAIITKSRCELGINEQKMEVGYLSPRDAAKMFLKLTYKKMKNYDRFLDKLAQKPLFMKAKLTPPMIWCMSQNFESGESVDFFGDKYLEDKKLLESETNTNSEIKIALESISKENEECYQLILFLGLFPAGLSTHDMEQLSQEEMIPKNWKVLIKKLIENTSSPSSEKTNQNFEDSKEITEKPHEESQELLPGNYAWINITKDANKETLHYKVADFLHEFITNELKQETVKQSLQRLEYMALLALSVIKYLKEISYCQESIIEYSSISDHGIWKFDDKNTFFSKWIKPRAAYIYIDEQKTNAKSLGVAEIRKILDSHSDNFRACLNSEAITHIMENMQNSHDREELADALEVACLAIPTVYKIIAGNTTESQAKDFCLQGLTISNKLDHQISKLSLLRAKLHLFQISLCFHLRKEKRTPLDDVYHELHHLKLHIQSLDGELYKTLSYYIAFTEAYMANKERKPGFFIQNKMLLDHKKKPQEILTMFKNTYDIVSKLGPDFQTERCKVAIMICKLTLKNPNKSMGIDAEIQEQIKAAIKLIRRKGQEQLQISARCQYARMLLHQMKYDAIRERKKVLEVSQYLTKIKNEYLGSHALSMAKYVNYALTPHEMTRFN